MIKNRLCTLALAGLSFAGCVVFVGHELWQIRARHIPGVLTSETNVPTPPAIVPIVGDEVQNPEAEIFDLPAIAELSKNLDISPGHRIDDAVDAARVAARHANARCLRLWYRQPFTADVYPARLQGERWHWGEYDPAGRGGFSAEVSFNRDGTDVRVEIFLSVDTLDVRR